MTEIVVEGADVLIVAILVLGLGSFITNRVSFLGKYSIPVAVTGGIICSLLILAIQKFGGPRISFDLRLRDLLLLIFFSTIGLSAKFNRLKAGGKPLAILTICAAVFLVIQNITGVLMAWSMEFATSIAFQHGMLLVPILFLAAIAALLLNPIGCDMLQ